jgi:hypothetical protein
MDDFRIALQEQARVNAAASKPAADTTYNQAVSHFKKYVDANDDLVGDDKYVTPANVSAYFTYVVAIKTTQPAGAKRIVNAIDKYAKDVEYTDGTVFKCHDLPLVVRALDNQKTCIEILWRIVFSGIRMENSQLIY